MFQEVHVYIIELDSNKQYLSRLTVTLVFKKPVSCYTWLKNTSHFSGWQWTAEKVLCFIKCCSNSQTLHGEGMYSYYSVSIYDKFVLHYFIDVSQKIYIALFL